MLSPFCTLQLKRMVFEEQYTDCNVMYGKSHGIRRG